MPVINRLPIGGGASEPGISDGQGIVKLNVFTQLTEPSIKDGIWIKTNNKYNKIMINQKYTNYESGVWSSQIALPSLFTSNYTFSACEYNGSIHLIFRNYHYIYNDSNNTYTKLNDVNTSVGYYQYPPRILVYNNKMYLLNAAKYNTSGNISSNFILIYNENNDTWSYITTPDYCNGRENGVVYDNNIIYESHSNNFYKFDGTTITQLYFNNTPSNKTLHEGGFISYNGEIHIFGGGIVNIDAGETYNNHYGLKFNNNGYLVTTTYNNTPTNYFRNVAAVLYNGDIHVLCSRGKYMHYKWNSENDTYTSISTPICYINSTSTLVKDGDIICFYPVKNSDKYDIIEYKFQSPEKIYNSNTVIIQKGITNNGTYLTNIADTLAIEGDGINNRFPSGFDDCYYFANTAFDWDAPMYYGDGTKWIKFKN